MRPWRPTESGLGDIAVVGAGISGLTCARILTDHGYRVRVFEKSRGPGGRMSTRRVDSLRFDHGAQYFTVRDPSFAGWADRWREDGIVARWEGRLADLGSEGPRPKSRAIERFVAVPGMNEVCRRLALDLDVTYQTRIGKLEAADGLWRLVADDGAELGRYHAVAISAPAPQAAELLRSVAPEMASRAAQVEMAPCWAAMASFAAPLGLGFDGAFVQDSPLSWVCRNDSKPGRPDGESWVLHGASEWSSEHLELDGKEAAKQLLQAFRVALGGLTAEPIYLEAHRWRFALPRETLAEPCLFDAESGLGACGDWCDEPRVEGAFLSGHALASRLLGLRARV